MCESELEVVQMMTETEIRQRIKLHIIAKIDAGVSLQDELNIQIAELEWVLQK